MSEQSTEEAKDTSGFRLHTVEVLNWGTFHHQIWRIDLEGQNGLLTGEIGSGKSTLVDAITTLIVPSQKIVFNKAAGATTKERDLRSYVMGFYKAQTNDYGNAEPIALRPKHEDYTVILAVFHNEDLKRSGRTDYEITLAQVFFMSNTQYQPVRLYVTAQTRLGIKECFTDFGNDPRNLRKKLRQHGAEIFESFAQYAAWWKRRFGLSDNEQAIELFAQTVSMKTVDNISSFVQAHMLQKVDTYEQIESIIDRFNDLNSTYASVCRARDMLALLEPMQEVAQLLASINEEINKLLKAKHDVDTFIGLQRKDLLTADIAGNERELNQIIAKLAANFETTQNVERDLETAKDDRRKNGGEQIESLQRQIKQEQLAIIDRKNRSASYEILLKTLSLNLPRSLNGFIEQRSKLAEKNVELSQRRAELLTKLIANGSEQSKLSAEISALDADIQYISEHPSNISVDQLKIREMICTDLRLNTNEMPFVGELIEIKDSEKTQWEGAIERVLHGFALSLLVPEDDYGTVMRYVDSHDLKGRLIYYRIRKDQRYQAKAPYPNELRTKLNIKDKGELSEFVRQMLVDNFAYICCEDYEQFKREHKAITQRGQIKSGTRHEKDDRRNILDRKNYVLGWSNTDKLMLLQKNLRELRQQLVNTRQIGENLTKLNAELENSAKVLARLEEYKSFAEIDYHSHMELLRRLQDELQNIEEGSDIFKMLNAKIDNLVKELAQLHQTESELTLRRGNLEGVLAARRKEYEEQLSELTDPQIDPQTEHFLSSLQLQVLDGHQLTLSQSLKIGRDMGREIDRQNTNAQSKASTQEKRLITAMAEFNHKYEVETNEIDASPNSWPQYANLLERIRSDDLPRFVDLFKKKLKNNTLNDVATLNAFLDSSASEISKRIDIINQALSSIEYNPGRHIQLVSIPTEDQEIRQFKHDLRQMVDNRHELDTAELNISEDRFMQVKELIDRFKGRAESQEADKRWRAKVTDVRRWYEFAAQELYDADGSQYEFYKDSSGKSGGQKEKLAYTILATSLAYQFGAGIEGLSNDRSFRFVIIDEAFGRGSDDSASFGLKLFRKLKLQLLVVTPMQKISIIEPYVDHVAFVAKNEDTSISSIRNLTIQEYRMLKKRHELLRNTQDLNQSEEENKSSTEVEDLSSPG